MEESSSNILVIYYSRKSDNERRRDTEDIAKWIAGSVGGRLFRVESADQYPDDDLTYVDRLRSEDWHRLNPAAKSYLKSINDYDIIFAGFPNWAGIVPRVIYTFLADYNLTGKRVIPFGINEIAEFNGNIYELQKICSEADVAEGMFVERKGLTKKRKTFEDWAKAHIS